MEQSILNVKIGSNDKKKFEKICNCIGMDTSTVICMFIKNVLAEKKLPFDIKPYTMDSKIDYKLAEAEEEMNCNTRRYSQKEVLKSMRDNIE